MINFVVALPCEARPLLAHYRLKERHREYGFRLYQNDDIRLILSGIGKINAAAATAFLHAVSGHCPYSAWINIGIGGHPKKDLGEGILANKVTDRANGQNWYPAILFDPPCATAAIDSVDVVEKYYINDVVYEMEAAGFISSASHFSTMELIHCFKVVSDNIAQPTQRLTKEIAEQLIAAQITTIDSIVGQLEMLSSHCAEQHTDPLQYARYLKQWRFTTYQQHRLRRLLSRWQVLLPSQENWLDNFMEVDSSKKVLELIQAKLDHMTITL